MREMDVGALPVVDGKALAGMVTDRDIAVRGVAAGMIPQESLVSDVMTEDVRCCRDATRSSEVMAADGRRCRCAGSPVLDADNEIVGIVALGDLATRQSAPHRRNSARDLDARSLNSSSNALQRYLSERLIGPAAQHVLRHPWRVRLADAEGVSRQPGAAARRRGRVLRAAVDRAAADPDGDRAVAL